MCTRSIEIFCMLPFGWTRPPFSWMTTLKLRQPGRRGERATDHWAASSLSNRSVKGEPIASATNGGVVDLIGDPVGGIDRRVKFVIGCAFC
jgi:hypothetical protein